MAKLFGAQRLVLQAIQDSPKGDAGFVSDTRIAQATSIALDNVRDWFDILDGEGLAEVARTTEGLSASITAKGRQELRKYQPISHPQAGESESPQPDLAGTSTTEQPHPLATEPAGSSKA